MKKILTLVLVPVLLGTASGFGGAALYGAFGGNETTVGVATQQEVGAVAVPTAGVGDTVELLKGSVVSIVETQELTLATQNPFLFFGNPFFGSPFGMPVPEQQQEAPKTEKRQTGAGTGFVVASDGTVLTNKHVVGSTEAEYTAVLADGSTYPVKVLARDPLDDLALVKLEGAPALTPVRFVEDAESVRVGDFVLAIGNALGKFENSVSFGVISAKNRSITAQDGRGSAESLRRLLQTDAAINPGNSGGPIVTLDGRVVGIATAVAGDAQGIGFAIPLSSGQVESMQEQVRTHGKFLRAYLGIRYTDITPELNKEHGLGSDTGAWVRSMNDLPAVLKDSPAAKAGIEGGDIIVKVDGVALTASESLVDRVMGKQVGEEVVLTVLRDGKEQEIRVVLEAVKE